MPKQSAGLLLYRTRGGRVEVFLIHPGGPLWAGKDEWSIPKGEFPEDEDPLHAARREFQEETGVGVDGDFQPLAPIRQPGGKLVIAWAVEGDLDPALLHSNMFSMEWPRGSGRMQEFPEADRGAWFGIDEARPRIFRGQNELLDQLEKRLSNREKRDV